MAAPYRLPATKQEPGSPRQHRHRAEQRRLEARRGSKRSTRRTDRSHALRSARFPAPPPLPGTPHRLSRGGPSPIAQTYFDEYHTIVSQPPHGGDRPLRLWCGCHCQRSRRGAPRSFPNSTTPTRSTALTVSSITWPANPPADMMVRQLAVPGVNTKWIEQHPDVPRRARDAASPSTHWRRFARTALQHHFQLRAKDTMINIALRCAQLGATVGDLERVRGLDLGMEQRRLRPDEVLITENAGLLTTPRSTSTGWPSSAGSEKQ